MYKKNVCTRNLDTIIITSKRSYRRMAGHENSISFLCAYVCIQYIDIV